MAQEIPTRGVINEYLRDVPPDPPEGFGDRGYVDLRDSVLVVDAVPDTGGVAPEVPDEPIVERRENSVEEPEAEQTE
eukprot:11216392-Alexandrium_andersonii.AAC.1